MRAVTYFTSFGGINARRWLLQIVRNIAYNSTARNRGIELVSIESEDETGAIADLAAPDEDPESNVINARDRRWVRSMIAVLPVELGEALVLREFDGLSYKEIAAVTRTPIGTVMSCLWRARQTLVREARQSRPGAVSPRDPAAPVAR